MKYTDRKRFPLPDMPQEKLSEVFNAFAAKAVQDYPRLKGELLILDGDTGNLYGHFDNKTRYTFVSDEDVAKSVERMKEGLTKIGSHATHIEFNMGGGQARTGELIAFQRSRATEGYFGREKPQLYDLLFTLYHELGHHLVKDSMHAGGDKEGRNFSESAADVYAMIRMRQHFPEVEESYFIDRVGLMRATALAHNGYTDHYTNFALDALKKAAKEIDLLALSPAQATELAWDIAATHSLARPVSFRIGEQFRVFRDDMQSKGAEEAVRALAERTLEGDNIIFRAGMQFLSPFLEGWAWHPQLGFEGEYWQDMRQKLSARADTFAQAGILSGFPRRKADAPAA